MKIRHQKIGNKLHIKNHTIHKNKPHGEKKPAIVDVKELAIKALTSSKPSSTISSLADLKEKGNEETKEESKLHEQSIVKHKKGEKSTEKQTQKQSNKQDKSPQKSQKITTDLSLLETYEFSSEGIPIQVAIQRKKGEFVPIYDLQISIISPTTEVILEGIRQELIRRVNLGIAEINDYKNVNVIEEKFDKMITVLIEKYFPDSDEITSAFLATYLKMKSLGLGNLELIMKDENLEEIVINESTEPVWVFHKKHGWLKTNIMLKSEEQIRHYASIVARKIGRQITVLTPLLDAHLEEGDRVNATLYPVSTQGNTITIRKFTKDPWTITKFLQSNTISYKAAALIWTTIQYEMSALIAGGTASGKTSALNVFAGFFPPNQRIISIEDTREMKLPKFLHWVPLNTVLPNPEGKGEITMQDLLVNSLRMRPDRILVGEVRRSREAETLFEAIHTGHSVYATFHANNAKETVERLTNAPINVPKIMIQAISLIIVQFRNRRSGKRRTFQIAEILPNGDANVILQYDPKKDQLIEINKSKSLHDNIRLFTGMTDTEFERELEEKITVLKYLVDLNIHDVDGVGRIIAEYYTNKENLMHFVKTKKPFEE
jgi:archaeal flagellar protein FlaI